MSEEYEDWCDDGECSHDKADHEFMVKHEMTAEDFDLQYQQLLSSNKDFGTYAMDELQAHVKSDIEAGCWD